MQANYNDLSCQLGGFTLNGNIQNGTAQSGIVVTINDPTAIVNNPVIDTSGNHFLKIKVGSHFYYLPVYQSI
jgi:hypothetical protein